MSEQNKPGPERGSSRAAAAPGRRRYVAPRITDYGTVSKLTQTGGDTTKDTGSMKRVCL